MDATSNKYDNLTQEAYDFKHARKLLGVGRTKFWELRKSGELKAVPIEKGGEPSRILREHLIEYLENRFNGKNQSVGRQRGKRKPKGGN
jgi:hypothetical protein